MNNHRNNMRLFPRNNQTADDATTLRDYIREINESSNGGFALTEDLDHWAGYGVLTRDQLGDYLDECVRQEDDDEDDEDDDDEEEDDNDDDDDEDEDDYDRCMPETDGESYYRECRAADSGDDMSKADYTDMYSRMGMEGDF